MIYLQVKGGLGNQLFQYSIGYFLKKKLGAGLCLDYSSAEIGQMLKGIKVNKKYSFRNIQLECFSLDSHSSHSSIVDFVIDQIIQKVCKSRGFTGRDIAPVIKEDGSDCRRDNTGVLDVAGQSKNVILSGYWQNIHYIEPVRTDLLRQFRMNISTGNEYKKEEAAIHSSESVGIHVRRGDFVSLGWEKGADYYMNAMSAARATIPNAKFYFFSDDIGWVRENLFDANDSSLVSISEDHADVKEFSLLSSCKHQIISESTFGWWAAYLNENPQKQVYIPFDCRGDIWLDEWNRIEYSKN